MKRRHAVKAIALTTVTPQFLFGKSQETKPVIEGIISDLKASQYESNWHNWPDMLWIGPEYWGNRLQDWEIRNGKAVCVVSEENRTLHSLTHQIDEKAGNFQSKVTLEWLNKDALGNQEAYTGFRLGAKGKFSDYRSAAVFGEGIDCGINGAGQLFIGEETSESKIPLSGPYILQLDAEIFDNKYELHLRLFELDNDKVVSSISLGNISNQDLTGNIAMVSHFPDKTDGGDTPAVAFSKWVLSGAKIRQSRDQVFGPICFVHYTLHDGILKMGAQLAPVEKINNLKVSLQIAKGTGWVNIQEGSPDPLGRVVQFKVDNYNAEEKVPYRVKLELPLKDGIYEYYYEGSIAEEPKTDKVKLAVFSCNADYGFPDTEVSVHSLKHRPDLAVFLGDQFYEGTGGFGIQISPLEKSSLDYLRKWYMFGWSYREIFRNIPAAFIPDDHDVYHGNVWGESGKKAPTEEGWGFVAQDQGGYKMPPEWVNMVQLTQTGHLPGPFDPTPVKQGITTYYTDWVYGGISFAILEDRKFKTAPKNMLPEEAKVLNGFIQNPEFDIKAHYDIDAELLGDRQMKFLEQWVTDWSKDAEMKAVLSQTNFCTVATLPKGSILDDIVPKLPIPNPGEYVHGDAPTVDMDSNGWPQKCRDEALRVIRKGFALHLAGDQHLGTVVQYGVEEFGDAGFAFAGPALNNVWPRRWWPPLNSDHQPLEGKAPYTGNFHDGFGNKITVHAAANPHKTGQKPALIYDRATGYAMVTFDKNERTMKLECWPRFIDPDKNPSGQYQGWPITISQADNYGRKAVGFLPILDLSGIQNPVVQLINDQSGEIEYSLRVRWKSFRPKVYEKGKYTLNIQDAATGKEKRFPGIRIAKNENETLKVILG
ncbi:alkaline phosphatase D family protein [Aquiflexum sp.]|uniref:alkaline phosphatase D family protein n=1 Tax=Aquiflexum sp. TaxID=1872584 RepID=UPI0035934B0B